LELLQTSQQDSTVKDFYVTSSLIETEDQNTVNEVFHSVSALNVIHICNNFNIPCIRNATLGASSGL